MCAQALGHLGMQFVVIIEIVEEASVDGVEVDDKELAHGVILVEAGMERSISRPLFMPDLSISLTAVCRW